MKAFAEPYLARGVQVVCARDANARVVAEFVFAQMLLGLKGYFYNVRTYRAAPPTGGLLWYGPGMFQQTVSLIGCGAVAQHLIALLKPFQLRILVVDPYLSQRKADALGVVKAELSQAFDESAVVSNHLPDLPELSRVLDRGCFERMREGGVFLNTGRGQQVNEADLADVFAVRPDLTALLDVTYPEPPVAASPLWTLPNVHLSAHIAGCMSSETVRMADLMIEEYQRWSEGLPLRHAISREMLATIG